LPSGAPGGRQALQRLALEHEVRPEVGGEARLAEEEAAVDPVLRARLLAEAGDAVALVEHGDAERQLRPDHGHRDERARRRVRRGQRAEVDIRDAVAVGGEEGRAVEAVDHRVDATAGRRVQAGVDALDAQSGRPVGAGRERLHQLRLEPGEQQDALDALGGVEGDDVPGDRQPADLHERLGDRGRMLLQARAPPTAQDDRGVGPERGHPGGA
jgi:hypothetical protein